MPNNWATFIVFEISAILQTSMQDYHQKKKNSAHVFVITIVDYTRNIQVNKIQIPVSPPAPTKTTSDTNNFTLALFEYFSYFSEYKSNSDMRNEKTL